MGFLFSHRPAETKYCLGQFSSVFYFSLWWAPLCVELLLGYQFTGVVSCCIPIIYRIYFYIYSIYYCDVYWDVYYKATKLSVRIMKHKGLKQKREKLCGLAEQPMKKFRSCCEVHRLWWLRSLVLVQTYFSFYRRMFKKILIGIKSILNETNLNNSFKIHHFKKRKKHFYHCTCGDLNRLPQQLSAGAPAAQIFTQICSVFLLVRRGSTHVLHENINCLFACRANALCR